MALGIALKLVRHVEHVHAVSNLSPSSWTTGVGPSIFELRDRMESFG